MPQSSARRVSREKNVFQFPRANPNARNLDRGLLLWRILQCQPEVRSGTVLLRKHPFFRDFRSAPERFSEFNANLVRNVNDLLRRVGRSDIDNNVEFASRVALRYRKELLWLSDRQRLVSFDILFQTIQLLSLQRDRKAALETIRKIGIHEEGGSINDLDREILTRHFRVYLLLSARIIKRKDLRKSLEERDELIAEAAGKHPGVMVYFLDAMFRNIVAQILLSRKYRCDTLLVEWLKEYGFEPEHLMRVARYIPFETGFLKFRTTYRAAIQKLCGEQHESDHPEESDVFLLRSLSNFYTSWIMRASYQIPA